MKMKEFEKLGLSKEVIKVLKEEGFEKPSEIQEKAIPILLKGKDLIGGSATGSGKTLAFAAPIIENLRPNRRVQALIMTPTRELAEQVSGSIRKFAKNKKLNVLAIYGGVNIEPQMRRIAVADVIVGTPGRILDHIQRRTLKLDSVKFLVLDEVDRMFDMGFHKDVERIINECPKERQTMLFSATISSEIDYLADKYTNNPEEVSVESYLDASKLKQIYYDVENNQKFSLLVHLLKEENADSIMVFCSTRRNVDFIVENLGEVGINAKAIHGGLDQKKRIRVLQDFHEKGVRVLVCTDVAARGLDIKDVSHVYNYDLPPTSNEYIHRIGRTARAGNEGIAISLLSNRDYENFSSITRDSSLNIVAKDLPRFDRVHMNSEFNGRRNFGDRGRSSGGRGNQGGNNRSFGNDKPRRDGNRSFGNNSGGRSSGNNRSFGNDRPRRDGNRSFGGNSEGGRNFGSSSRSFGDSKPHNSGRSYGSRDKKSSKNFNSKKPQRFDRKRPNTRRPTSQTGGRR